MSVKTRLVDYDDGHTSYQGMIAFDDTFTGQRPGVLVANTIRGCSVHAFTNPAANDTTRGTVYDAAADRRSWVAMKNFLDELFSG